MPGEIPDYCDTPVVDRSEVSTVGAECQVLDGRIVPLERRSVFAALRSLPETNGPAAATRRDEIPAGVPGQRVRVWMLPQNTRPPRPGVPEYDGPSGADRGQVLTVGAVRQPADRVSGTSLEPTYQGPLGHTPDPQPPVASADGEPAAVAAK